MDELKGLKYDEFVLGHNAHKLTGEVTIIDSGVKMGQQIREDGFWLVAGLGEISLEIPEDILVDSLSDVIILSKKDLIEFIKSKREIKYLKGK